MLRSWRRTPLAALAIVMLAAAAGMAVVAPLHATHRAGSCAAHEAAPAPTPEQGHDHHRAAVTAASVSSSGTAVISAAQDCQHCPASLCAVTGHCGSPSTSPGPLAVAETPVPHDTTALAAAGRRPKSVSTEPPTPPPTALL